MKTIIKQLFFFFLLVVGMYSCQSEFEDVFEEQQQEDSASFTVNSTEASLLLKTATLDGSYDNIVDQSSCFAIAFPYTVSIGNQSITIENEDDFDKIEDLFDAFEDDEDNLEIIFPVTVVLSNFEEIVIPSLAAFETLQDTCETDEIDDDIECIDIIYPITLFSFDPTTAAADTVEVNSDQELRRLLANLPEGRRLQIEFPIALKPLNQEPIVVNSLAQMITQINAYKESCDEDDDNDYNDDDFELDLERFKQALTNCVWEVKYIKRFEENFSNDLKESLYKFDPDGTVALKKKGEEAIKIGVWGVTLTGQGIQLEVTFEGEPLFTGNFLVQKVGEDQWRFFINDENRIRVKRDCEAQIEDNDDRSESLLALKNLLKTCSWILEDLVIDNQEDKSLLAYQLEFEDDNELTVSVFDKEYEGVWALNSTTTEALVLTLTVPELPQLNGSWSLSSDITTTLEFGSENGLNNLRIVKACEGNGNLEFFEEVLEEVNWKVAEYVLRGDDLSNAFQEMKFVFEENGQLKLIANNANTNHQEVLASGVWQLYFSLNGTLKLTLNLEESNEYSSLSNDYEVIGISEQQLSLKHLNPDESISEIIFLPLDD